MNAVHIKITDMLDRHNKNMQLQIAIIEKLSQTRLTKQYMIL